MISEKTYLSKHFTLAEATFSSAAVRLSLDNTPDEQTLKNMRHAAVGMEQIRDEFGHPIHVDSWFRSLLVNRAIGSSDTSAHVQGWAIDFICPDFGAPLSVCRKIIGLGIEFDQLIFEGAWTHISFHPAMRQDVRTAVFKKGQKTRYPKGLPE